ncbi:MAG: O-acetylhomoserine aminocarboxypropyltransferase/cysteine synthase [Clostridia bacterium]|nr:O-acetylhomoserine aminocarboxypropyltransferase/cysteine synthase [Clostridia bacterium]
MRIETKCIQEGYEPKNGEPRMLPIFQSTTYKYDSAEHLGKLFDLEAPGHMYTRISNPTVDAVEKKIAALEGGVGALCTSGGQAASLISVMNICRAGDHVISSSAIYGGTLNLFDVTLRKFGIETTFIPPDADEETLNAAFRENTKLVFAESLSNPSLAVVDLELFSRVAHAHGVPLIIDNTFPTAVNCRPFEHGADIVIHSTSKYMDGHGVSLGGVIIDSGKFTWSPEKFPDLNEPDESYHGVSYVRDFGEAAYITKARVQLMRDLASSPSPFNAFLLNLGLETLPLRMKQHCENAQKVAAFLDAEEKVAWVCHPSLKSHPQYELGKKYLKDDGCGVISFGVKGGRDAAMKLMNSLKLAKIVVHVADARTCVLHPASTTHRQLSDQQLIECGVKPEMIRLSVGIEHADDIIEDLKQALETL